jgi:hypothetical protein
MSPVPMIEVERRIVTPIDAYRGENMEFAAALQSLLESSTESRFHD